MLFVVPGTYQYAPIVGGLVAGALQGSSRDGFRAGVLLGLVIVPVGVLLGLLAMVSPGVETGGTVMFASMGTVGPTNALFYAILVTFVVAYTTVAGSVSAAVGGSISGVVQDRLVDAWVENIPGTVAQSGYYGVLSALARWRRLRDS